MRNSFSYQASKLGEGLLADTWDEGIGKTAGVITDFFIVGDIRDLTVLGYFANRNVAREAPCRRKSGS